MSEENVKVVESQGDEIAKMKEYFEKLRNPQGNKPDTGLKGEELLKKMFTPRNQSEIFRILPVKNPSEVTQEAHFHVIQITTGANQTRFKKLYCPAHNDELVSKLHPNGEKVLDQEGNPVMVKPYCALCEKAKFILDKQDNSTYGIKKENLTDAQKAIREKNTEIWKEGTKWEAKKFHIIRGIDRGIEKDGVKFWRFKDNRRQQGVLDKLIPVLGDYMSFSNALFYDKEKGADISISVAEIPLPGGARGTYKDVSSINYRPSTPLSNDTILVEQWLNDKITWKDVFRKQKAPNCTNQQYLELVAEGNNPYWDDSDQSNKKWVFPNHPELEEKANTRDKDLDVEKKEESSQSTGGSNVNINSVTVDDVKPTAANDTVNYGSTENQEAKSIDDEIDDLPF